MSFSCRETTNPDASTMQSKPGKNKTDGGSSLKSQPQTCTQDASSSFSTTTSNSKQSKADHMFKPIKVDNWQSCVCSKLFSLFLRKEKCDVELCFADGSSPIPAHSLVLDLCTDYFSKRAKPCARESAYKHTVVLPSSMTKTVMQI